MLFFLCKLGLLRNVGKFEKFGNSINHDTKFFPFFYLLFFICRKIYLFFDLFFIYFVVFFIYVSFQKSFFNLFSCFLKFTLLSPSQLQGDKCVLFVFFSVFNFLIWNQFWFFLDIRLLILCIIFFYCFQFLFRTLVVSVFKKNKK